MTYSLHDALKLNNQAVALYRSNDLNRAAKAYYHSLCSLNRLLKKCYYDCDHCSSEHDGNAITISSLPQHECLHSFAPLSRYQEPDTSISNNDDEPFVYQGALMALRESPSSLQHDTLAIMTIYSAGILFNTAILHHQHAMTTGKSLSLDRASQLYEASLHLMGQLLCCAKNSTTTTVSLIVIAASNNLAQIELSKGLLRQGCIRVRALKSLIHSSRHLVSEIFTSDERQGLLSNTISAYGMIASAAA